MTLKQFYLSCLFTISATLCCIAPTSLMGQSKSDPNGISGGAIQLHTEFRPTKELFAIKTNLLFDAVTALNAEIEVPIGKRLSVSGEILFPWWLMDKRQNCFQVIAGTGEVKYWLGDREITRKGVRRLKMTGWFLGVYAGGGIYDLEYKGKGYQGSFYNVGLEGGYAHAVGCNMRMEYSLGTGVFKTKYDRYIHGGQCDQDKLVWQYSGNYSMFGPTRAKISLVWMISYRQKTRR